MTRDFDDALSLHDDGDVIHLGIHIADVSSLLHPDSPLDHAARSKASSLYLPRCQISMLPDRLAHDILSLRQDCDRPAISLLIRLNSEGTIIDHRFSRSLIRVREQLTYDQVNKKIQEDHRLQWLARFSRQLRERRIDQGALILTLPEASITATEHSRVNIDLLPQDTPSRMMVAELMILYNWLGALYCRDHQIPILYRRQDPPTERLNPDNMNYIYYVFMQRRKLNRLVIKTDPKPHAGLGLNAYTNLSSPIRRYLDLIGQRQLSGFLKDGTLVYHRQRLDEIRMEIEPVLKKLTLIQRNRVRYWILKYLGQHIGEVFPAIVLDVLKSKYRILITDLLIVTEIKQAPLRGLASGESIRVKVTKSDPWEDVLGLESEVMEPVGPEPSLRS
jgi:exoribonuclease-2